MTPCISFFEITNSGIWRCSKKRNQIQKYLRCKRSIFTIVTATHPIRTWKFMNKMTMRTQCTNSSSWKFSLVKMVKTKGLKMAVLTLSASGSRYEPSTELIPIFLATKPSSCKRKLQQYQDCSQNISIILVVKDNSVAYPISCSRYGQTHKRRKVPFIQDHPATNLLTVMLNVKLRA